MSMGNLKQMKITTKKLYYSNNRLNGYIMLGNIEKGIYTTLVREKTFDTLDLSLCKMPSMAFSKEEGKTVGVPCSYRL